MTDFPSDLITAEQQRQQAATARARLARTLPWSAKPLDGFSDPDIWRPRARPDSPGYSDEQAAQWGELQDAQLKWSEQVAGHKFWDTFTGAEAVAVRMELKQVAAGQAPNPEA